MFKNKKYYEYKIMTMEEADRKELFDAMSDFRKRHVSELMVSGWSDKYNELLAKQHEVITKFFPEDQDDWFKSDKIWYVLSELYIYN